MNSAVPPVTEPPAGWSLRRPVRGDEPAILDLVHAGDIAAVGEPGFTAAEVHERLTAPHTDPARDCWLALDPSGTIVGWAYPHNPSGGARDFIEVYVWPQRGEPALRPLLALLLDRATERGRDVRAQQASGPGIAWDEWFVGEVDGSGPVCCSRPVAGGCGRWRCCGRTVGGV